MQSINLNGPWQLYWREQEIGSSSAILPDFAGLKSIPAVVPGNVEIDLQAAGLLPDINFGNNIWQVTPYESAEWWYVRSFDVSKAMVDEGAELIFEGIDTLADIWLNGRQVGACDNMLIEHRFDASKYLHAGANQLVVHIRSALIEGRKHVSEPYEYAMRVNWESLTVRKAAHMFGWDIMPRLISAGIWRGVRLEQIKRTKIVDCYYVVWKLVDDTADLQVRWQFQAPDTKLTPFTLNITGNCKNSSFSHCVQPVSTTGLEIIKIKNPELWWPKGYGAANLYDVKIELLRDGEVVDSRDEKIGIRTICLQREDGVKGKAAGKFLFTCNGEPIMVKGTNHVPLDSLHSRDTERMMQTLELFDDCGCNMVRCWGGNVYEDHAFFDFCDAHGIMVWQDFGFGCASYPQTDDFQKVVENEAANIIRKLRNHPSIALWAGDNEVDMFLIELGMNPGNNRLTRETLPKVVSRCDPYRPFLPSSPYYSDDVISCNDLSLAPEQHLWGPRDDYKGPFYAQNTAVFASEIGYHGCPNINSIKQFISPDKLWPCLENDEWITHAVNPSPTVDVYKYRIKLMLHQIDVLFGFTPKSLDEFAVASQISQAEAVKYFIEMFRATKWQRTGILWWNMIDGWPQFSDAVVDYYGGKKLAYHYIKRVQTPICVMMQDPQDGKCNVVLANDTLKHASGWSRVIDADSRQVLFETDFEVAANSNKILGSIEVCSQTSKMLLIESSVGCERLGNHYWAGNRPLDFNEYANKWLADISSLPCGFDWRQIGKN